MENPQFYQKFYEHHYIPPTPNHTTIMGLRLCGVTLLCHRTGDGFGRVCGSIKRMSANTSDRTFVKMATVHDEALARCRRDAVAVNECKIIAINGNATG